MLLSGLSVPVAGYDYPLRGRGNLLCHELRTRSCLSDWVLCYYELSKPIVSALHIFAALAHSTKALIARIRVVYGIENLSNWSKIMAMLNSNERRLSRSVPFTPAERPRYASAPLAPPKIAGASGFVHARQPLQSRGATAVPALVRPRVACPSG